jgi:sugar transferase (PEP-CTERM/EpsH1 system associated)
MKPELLFLAHRIPYPPNRGDKIRSWHILRHLGRFATVHLGCFGDNAADAAHLPALREAMEGSLGEAYAEPLAGNQYTWVARALATRRSITTTAMASAKMQAFVQRILAERPIAGIYAYSVQTAQYVPADLAIPFVMDFVDFDSVKYAEYARSGGMAGRLLHGWEARRMFALEKTTAARADVSLFVSEAEAALFRAEAGLPRADIRALANGIDLAFYDPAAGFAPLAPRTGPLLVFTGQMNYRPNARGVAAFVEAVFPLLRAARPDLEFAIVGRNPPPAIQALALRPGVIVTGEVPDVRPWLAAASIVVAPLQIARGVQNKVLEAMAMARPVVASPGAFEGIEAEPGRDLLVADTPDAQAQAILSLLGDSARAAAIGEAARRRMVDHYSWDVQLAPLAAMFGQPAQRAAA